MGAEGGLGSVEEEPTGKTGRPMEGTRDAGASSSSGPGVAPVAAAATGQTTGVGNEGSVREEKCKWM